MRRPRRMASSSSAARWSESPETRECISAPPSDSSSASSPVAIFSSGGPARNTLARSLTITTWSDMPGQVGAAGRRVAEHEGDRRDAVRRRPGQVAERAPAGDEDVLLGRQVGAAGLDEMDRRQAVLEGDVGGAERLAQRVRVARPAAYRRIAGADQAFHAADDADAGDDAGADGVVRAVRRQRAELEERGVLVDEQLDALAGKQLAALVMALGVLRPAAGDRLGVLGVDLGELGEHRLPVGGELGGRSRAHPSARCDENGHSTASASGMSTWRDRSHSPSALACGSKRALRGDAVAEQPIDDEVEGAQVGQHVAGHRQRLGLREAGGAARRP